MIPRTDQPPQFPRIVCESSGSYKHYIIIQDNTEMLKNCLRITFKKIHADRSLREYVGSVIASVCVDLGSTG